MAVLTDIRGLLTSPRKPSENMDGEERKADAIVSPDERTTALETKVLKQQEVIAQLQKERDGLLARVAALEARPVSLAETRSLGISRETSDIEARKDELEKGLTQLEALLQMKVKELARRIARVYEEAGDYGATRDFRRTSDQLESSENFGEFLRALARD